MPVSKQSVQPVGDAAATVASTTQAPTISAPSRVITTAAARGRTNGCGGRTTDDGLADGGSGADGVTASPGPRVMHISGQGSWESAFIIQLHDYFCLLLHLYNSVGTAMPTEAVVGGPPRRRPTPSPPRSRQRHACRNDAPLASSCYGLGDRPLGRLGNMPVLLPLVATATARR